MDSTFKGYTLHSHNTSVQRRPSSAVSHYCCRLDQFKSIQPENRLGETYCHLCALVVLHSPHVTLYKRRRCREEYVLWLYWRPVCFVHWMHIVERQAQNQIPGQKVRGPICASNVTRTHVHGEKVLYAAHSAPFSLCFFLQRDQTKIIGFPCV